MHKMISKDKSGEKEGKTRTGDDSIRSNTRTGDDTIQLKTRTGDDIIQSKTRTGDDIIQSKTRTGDDSFRSKTRTDDDDSFRCKTKTDDDDYIFKCKTRTDDDDSFRCKTKTDDDDSFRCKTKTDDDDSFQCKAGSDDDDSFRCKTRTDDDDSFRCKTRINDDYSFQYINDFHEHGSPWQNSPHFIGRQKTIDSYDARNKRDDVHAIRPRTDCSTDCEKNEDQIQEHFHITHSRADYIPDGEEAKDQSGTEESRNDLIIDGEESPHKSNCTTHQSVQYGNVQYQLIQISRRLYMYIIEKQRNEGDTDTEVMIIIKQHGDYREINSLQSTNHEDYKSDALTEFNDFIHNERAERAYNQEEETADENEEKHIDTKVLTVIIAENVKGPNKSEFESLKRVMSKFKKRDQNRKKQSAVKSYPQGKDFVDMKSASETVRVVKEKSNTYNLAYRGNITPEMQRRLVLQESSENTTKHKTQEMFHGNAKSPKDGMLPHGNEIGQNTSKRLISDRSDSDRRLGSGRFVTDLRSGGRPREVPTGGVSQNSQSSGGHDGRGRAQPIQSEFQLFLNFWKLNFDGNSRRQLTVALQEECSEEVGTQSTMMLLDVSDSITETDLNNMKTTVRTILNKAEEASKSNSKEAYGLAIFGRSTKILHMPTTNYQDITSSLDLIKTSGLSPLGLGLIMCASVWLGRNGLPGTVWINGRKVSSKIILITDFKPNQTVKTEESRYEPPENDDLDGNETVYLELKAIAESLAKLELPVYVIPTRGDSGNQGKMRTLARVTGGELLDDSSKICKIGRRARVERLRCVATSYPEAEFQSTLEWICENEEEVREVLNLAFARRSLETELGGFNVDSLGEPGQHIYRELFALGTRVCKSNRAETTGTVVSHAPQNGLKVHWDWDETMQDCQVTDLRDVKTHRTLPKSGDVPLQIGCKVRLVKNDKPTKSKHKDDRCGTIVGVATLQRDVFYISWENEIDGEENDPKPREISRYRHPEQIECERVSWSHNVFGRFEEFDCIQNDKLEKTFIQRKSRTILVTLNNERYRAIFATKKLRHVSHEHAMFEIKRDPEYLVD